jgi:hypothetical protein
LIRVKWLLAGALIASLILLSGSPAQAQSGIALENVEAAVRFGEGITFLATVHSSVPVQSASILISVESQGINHDEPLAVQAGGRAEFYFDTRQNGLRPFTQVKWSYKFTLSGGSTVQSEPFVVRYADDRFNWQTLESDLLTVSWYEGDEAFGRTALNAALEGASSIRQLMALELSQPVEIYIYAATDDLRGTLVTGGEDWMAGHVDPVLGVAMVVIEPGAGQGIALEQRLPHELMHVLLYRRVGAGYHKLPAWLREGTAALAEIYPNAEYDRALTDAVTRDQLIPLRELCEAFPGDAGRAFLAYAESRSFAGYLRERYGSTGLLDLAAAYADGLDCERGTERAFGVSLANLETDWRSSVLGADVFRSTVQDIAPYLVLLCLVLVIPLAGIAGTLRKKR